MKKRMITAFLIVLTVGISITGFFFLEVTRNFYMKSLQEKLISNGKLASQLIEETPVVYGDNYDYLARKLSSYTSARVTIIAADGKVMGESDLDSASMENHGERSEVKDVLKGAIGKSIRYSSTEGIEMLYIAIPLAGNSLTGGVVRMAVPLTEIRKIQLYFLGYVLLAIFAGLLFSFLIACRFARKITKPINQITSISYEISKGSYDKRIILDSKDELGQLAETFNNMAQKLELTIWELSDKKDKLEAILKSMESGVIAVDNTGRVILVNPAANEMFEFEENIVGKNVIEAIRNAELEEVIRSHEDKSREIQLNYPKKRTLRVKATTIKSTENPGKVIGVVAVLQDITELKQLEKMRTEFVANVSHELKTPLTSIKGFTETLKNGAINDSSAREKFLDIINVEADRLTRLINDILALSELESKKQSLPLEKIDINKSIEEIEDMMKSLSKLKNISLGIEKGPGIPKVLGSQDKVKQLLINLIDNAIKYTQEGGRIHVKSYYEDGRVYIEICDTGIGIPKEHLPRLFERFYRVDKGRSRALGGTGLGLAIVKHIAAGMGGDIRVNSEPGKGTKFIVTIPKA